MYYVGMIALVSYLFILCIKGRYTEWFIEYVRYLVTGIINSSITDPL